MQRIAQLDQRSEAGVAQFLDRTQEARRQLLTLFLVAVLVQQQVAELLFEAVNLSQGRVRFPADLLNEMRSVDPLSSQVLQPTVVLFYVNC